MVRTGALAGVAVAAALALPAAASAQYPSPPDMGGGDESSGDESSGAEPAAQIEARGDAFDGMLAFDPNDVSVELGDLVRWTNVDDIAPHTATEDHRLWRLTGDYGETPANPPGFGPGESRERTFEASTFSYFCEVHPDDMHGVVRVPVKLRQARGDRVKAKWGTEELPEDQVFDVQRRKRKKWRTVLKGTEDLKETFDSREGKKERFRARLRFAKKEDGAAGWSPPAKLKVK